MAGGYRLRKDPRTENYEGPEVEITGETVENKYGTCHVARAKVAYPRAAYKALMWVEVDTPKGGMQILGVFVTDDPLVLHLKLMPGFGR